MLRVFRGGADLSICCSTCLKVSGGSPGTRHVAGRTTSAGPSHPLPSPHRAHSTSNLTGAGSASSIPSRPSRYGQPHRSTHPHLLGDGELTRGLRAEEYDARRKKLMDSLPKGSVVICMGGTVKLMSQCELSATLRWTKLTKSVPAIL